MTPEQMSDLHAMIMMAWPVLLASIFAVRGYLAHELRSLRIAVVELQINQAWMMSQQGIREPTDHERTQLLPTR